MKKLFFVFSLIISVSACNQSNQQVIDKPADTISTGKNSIQYTCPMHPEIVKNKPGTCEKCGMDLVAKQSK
ncbi:MAG: heavy metal-binding domain-containing protein [Janthinobacterium lividum]